MKEARWVVLDQKKKLTDIISERTMNTTEHGCMSTDCAPLSKGVVRLSNCGALNYYI